MLKFGLKGKCKLSQQLHLRGQFLQLLAGQKQAVQSITKGGKRATSHLHCTGRQLRLGGYVAQLIVEDPAYWILSCRDPDV